MIVTEPAIALAPQPVLLHQTFRSWQRDTMNARALQVIGISGTRGKSTVLRLLEAILDHAHLRSATWTDLGVHIQGRRQRGELSGWSHALTRLSEGSIDIALQELDWATVNAVGLPPQSYPVIALTGLRERTDSAEQSPFLQSALRAANRLVQGVHGDGFIVVNGDDYYAIDAIADTDASVFLVAQSHQSPSLRRHLEAGGSAVWVRHGSIMIGDQAHITTVCRLQDVPITMNGEASFNVTNVLIAIALARGIGLDIPCIVETVSAFRSRWDVLPASMNVYEGEKQRAVVDQLGPAWVLRPMLKAINPMAARRQVTVVGDLRWVAPEEIGELGRLLGRHHGAIVLHSEQDEALVDEFRRGISANEYPPLFIRLPTERKAILRALKTVKSDDVLLILTTGDSAAAHRAVRRHIAGVP